MPSASVGGAADIVGKGQIDPTAPVALQVWAARRIASSPGG